MLLAEDLEVCTLFVLRLHQLLLSKRVPDDRVWIFMFSCMTLTEPSQLTHCLGLCSQTLKKTIDRLTDLLVCSDNTSQFDEVYCKKLLDRMTGHFYRNELESWVVQHIKVPSTPTAFSPNLPPLFSLCLSLSLRPGICTPAVRFLVTPLSQEFCASNSLRKTCSLLSSHEESSILSEKFARHTQRAGQVCCLHSLSHGLV